jgi:hypothetical protein
MSPEALARQHTNSYVGGQDIPAPQTHSSMLQEFLGRLTLSKLQRNRIHSFDFENELPATIFLLPNIAEGNTSTAIPQTFTNFILTNVQEDRREKFQVFETFGDPALFFFDKKTPIYSFSGFLIDSEHQDETRAGHPPDDKGSWAKDFRNMWETELRGTKLIENNKLAAISFNKTVIYGYPVNLSIQTDARQPFTAAFSFNMVVKKHKLDGVGSTFMDIRLFMSSAHRFQFDTGMKNLHDMEAALKTLQETYEAGVAGGLNRDTLDDLENQINTKYTRIEEVYIELLQLVQSAILFSSNSRYNE